MVFIHILINAQLGEYEYVHDDTMFVLMLILMCFFLLCQFQSGFAHDVRYAHAVFGIEFGSGRLGTLNSDIIDGLNCPLRSRLVL